MLAEVCGLGTQASPPTFDEASCGSALEISAPGMPSSMLASVCMSQTYVMLIFVYLDLRGARTKVRQTGVPDLKPHS